MQQIKSRFNKFIRELNTLKKDLSLKNRFLMHEMSYAINTLTERDPFFTLIALLKKESKVGRIIYGTIEDLHKERNRKSFKNFFFDQKLYNLVKTDIEAMFEKKPDLQIIINRYGLMIYLNYKKNLFNVLLLTIHSGTWLPESIYKSMTLKKEFRYTEEDIATDKIYSPLILEKAGIWIDNKQSRFSCDFNRHIDKAIYSNSSEGHLWKVKRLWKKKPTKDELTMIIKTYEEFYFILMKLLDIFKFNIIFDGHSMRHKPGRPELSFGVEHIPPFYVPIVKSMREKLHSLGYKKIYLNKPYKGGFILKWLASMYPDLFIFSMEVNKKLYMSRDWKKLKKAKLEKVAADLKTIFDLEVQLN